MFKPDVLFIRFKINCFHLHTAQISTVTVDSLIYKVDSSSFLVALI